jgi:hypothetical protein
MIKINKNPDELIEAICLFSDRLQLNPSNEKILANFNESNSFDDLQINHELIQRIEHMEDKAPKLWPEFCKIAGIDHYNSVH